MLKIVSNASKTPARHDELRDGVASIMRSAPYELVFASDEAETCREIGDAQILLGWTLTESVFRAAPQLRWVHLGAAGVERSLFPAFLASNVTMTNSRGIHAVPMAEWALSVLLMISQRLREAEAWKRDHQWKLHKEDMTQTRWLLRGGKALIIGYGAIGQEIAKVFSAVGISCEGVARISRNADIPLHGNNKLSDVIGKFDIVVIAMPLTRETDGMISREVLKAMKPGSILVNLSRGRIIDEAALIDVLREGPLGYAALDVFQTEPLPEDSPLFRLPNVIMTPHVAGNFPDYSKMVIQSFLRNLQRYVEGRPLENVVDKARGY